MLVDKDKVKFTIKSHSKINSNTGARSQIDLFFEAITYSYTHLGFVYIDADDEITCPRSFYPKEAENFIKDLPDKIEVAFNKADLYLS